MTDPVAVVSFPASPSYAARLSLPLFVAMWNRIQGQTTPHVHLDMCHWLEENWRDAVPRALLMAFRACGKSTVVGLFCAWVLMRRPDHRILVVSADEHLAGRMVRNVRRIIEQHPATSGLRPEHADQWAADRFTIRRSLELRDPSMVACGVLGNLTGLRADFIICDDVEVPNTADTADKRDSLRARLHELSFVCSPGAQMLYVGTPHTFDTIYATEARADISGHTPFLKGYRALRVPVLRRNGQSVWPEKFSSDLLARQRVEVGPSAFQSQMMLTPVNLTQSHLSLDDLVVHNDDVVEVRERRQLYIGETRMVSCSAFWDPAFGRGSGDGSVLSVVYTDVRGHLWLQNVTYLRVPDDAPDSAAAQSIQVARILHRLRVPVLGVETNGIGRFLPGVLRREINQLRVPVSVVEIHHHRPKAERILSAFEGPMAARMLHVHQSVLQTPFADELRDWRPDTNGNRDDGLDAAAGAILMEPVRLPGGSGGGVIHRPAWRASAFSTR